MLCQSCEKKQATTHIKTIVNGELKEYRLCSDCAKKYGYTSGQAVEGRIITVDDQWGGLRLEVPMSIQFR